MIEKPPIRGIVLANSQSGANTHDLIVQATAAEVAAIALHDTVAFAKQESGPPLIGHDMMLYDAQGRPVAMITQYNVTHEKIDVTTFNDATPHYLPGRRQVSISAVGIGALRFATEDGARGAYNRP